MSHAFLEQKPEFGSGAEAGELDPEGNERTFRSKEVPLSR